jgi:hypothetical protein
MEITQQVVTTPASSPEKEVGLAEMSATCRAGGSEVHVEEGQADP